MQPAAINITQYY